MENFSSVQKRKVRDMLNLEYYPKDSELLTEGVVNDKAFIIVKGEVEIKSRTNLYTLSL
jgi:signal-transduction protein with cAMP-binding, CBS, and nucleotidyltransferase domain